MKLAHHIQSSHRNQTLTINNGDLADRDSANEEDKPAVY